MMLVETNGRASFSRGPMKTAKPLTAKVVKPRLEANPTLIQGARRLWMTRSGLPKEEIDEYCNLEKYPGTLEDELEQITALTEIEKLNTKIKWNV